MGFEVFPPVAKLFPLDEQRFVAQIRRPLRPLWANVPDSGTSIGVVQSDYSVRYVQGLSVSGEGALELVDGVGTVEWTMTANGMPTGSSEIGLRWRFYFDGTTPQAHEYFVYILGATISIENTGGVIETINYNVAVGDVFKVELASGFRLYINGDLKHSLTTFATPIKYPATYDAFANDTAATNPPIIPAPLLLGDWQLRAVVEFTTPVEGSLTDNGPALFTDYFDGEVPGQYKLAANINPGIDVWVEDAALAGATVNTSGGLWQWISSPPPAPVSGTLELRSPNAAGEHKYVMQGASATLRIEPGDILTCWVWLHGSNTPTEVMLEYIATDDTSGEHRAYWGANNITSGGVDGTASRRFMGPLPATGTWVRLEVAASLLDLEGRTLNGMVFSLYDGQADFDQAGKYPGKIQYAEALIAIPPLQVIGPLEREVEPEETTKIQTNYDVASTPPTLSIVSGGGTITLNQFTAPSAPGPTVVRASASGNQVADVSINVPAIITPSFRAAGPAEQIDFDTNIGPRPVFIAAGTVAEGTGAVVPGIPLGIQAKDVLLLYVESANQSVATPDDWAIAADSPQGTGTGGDVAATRLSIFWLRVPDSGTVSAPTITDPGDHAVAYIRAYRNCIDTGNPWDVTAGNTASSSTSVSIPGDTTTVPNCLIVQAVAFATDTATPQLSSVANADLTELAEVADIATTQGNGGGFAIVEGVKAAQGAFGATTATLAGASVQGLITIALRPALVVWSASAGSMNSSTGVWQAPGVTDPERPVRITATNGTFTATADVFVLPLFPLENPSAPITAELSKTVLISISEDRSSLIARVKDKDGLHYQRREVVFNNCELDELESVVDFWQENHPGKKFILRDNSRPAKPRIICYFDSDLRYELESSCAVNVSFRIREA